jgi:hypothetical protein
MIEDVWWRDGERVKHLGQALVQVVEKGWDTPTIKSLLCNLARTQ